MAGYGRQNTPVGRGKARIRTTRRSVGMGSRSSLWGPRFPCQGAHVCTCVCARGCAFLTGVSAERSVLPALCLPPCGHAQWDSGSPLASWRLAFPQLPEAGLCPRSPGKPPTPTPTPAPPLLGHGPARRLLRSYPAKRLNRNQMFRACLLPPLATLLSLSCLFWSPAPRYLRRASRGLPMQYSHPGPLPSPSASPLPWSHQGFLSPPVPLPQSQTQKTELSTFLPSAACVLSSAVRPARGAALGGRLLAAPPSHQEGFGPS